MTKRRHKSLERLPPSRTHFEVIVLILLIIFGALIVAALLALAAEIDYQRRQTDAMRQYRDALKFMKNHHENRSR